MSAEVKRMKEEGRKRAALSGEAIAPARHSRESENPHTSSFRTPRSGDPESSFVGNGITVGDLLTIIRGVTYKKEDASAESDAEGVPILRATNIQHGNLTFDGLVYVPRRCVSDEQLLHVGDIVVAASSGSRNVVGKAAPVKAEWFGSFGAFCFGLRPKPGVDPDYLAWFLQTSEYRQQVSELAAGVNINNLRAKHIQQIPIPVPAIERQRSIVAEIEKQFTHLDAGVSALRRVQANLKRYRAAVLKAACEGRLAPTEAELAKAEGRTYETGEQLLARILADRRKYWHGRGKYKEPAAADTSKLPPLPEGWARATLDGISAIKGGITKDQKRKFDGPARSVPYLRVANVQRGYLDLSEVKEILATEAEIDELALQPGDMLFNEGGDRDKLGRGWIWNEELPECIHQNHVFRARLFGTAIYPKFVSWYANTFGQKFFFDEGKHTTNLASISMSKLKSLPVPLPPRAEQTRIVAEVERRLSVVEELEAVVTANLRRATRLRQSILQRAFHVGDR